MSVEIDRFISAACAFTCSLYRKKKLHKNPIGKSDKKKTTNSTQWTQKQKTCS